MKLSYSERAESVKVATTAGSTPSTFVAPARREQHLPALHVSKQRWTRACLDVNRPGSMSSLAAPGLSLHRFLLMILHQRDTCLSLQAACAHPALDLEGKGALQPDALPDCLSVATKYRTVCACTCTARQRRTACAGPRPSTATTGFTKRGTRQLPAPMRRRRNAQRRARSTPPPAARLPGAWSAAATGAAPERERACSPLARPRPRLRTRAAQSEPAGTGGSRRAPREGPHRGGSPPAIGQPA